MARLLRAHRFYTIRRCNGSKGPPSYKLAAEQPEQYLRVCACMFRVVFETRTLEPLYNILFTVRLALLKALSRYGIPKQGQPPVALPVRREASRRSKPCRRGFIS